MTFELSCKVIPMNSHVKSFPNSGIQNDPTGCMPLSKQICLALGSAGNTLPATKEQSLFKQMNWNRQITKRLSHSWVYMSCLQIHVLPTMSFRKVCLPPSNKTLWMMNTYFVILFHGQSLPGRLVNEFGCQ